jgi:hypothetical protein
MSDFNSNDNLAILAENKRKRDAAKAAVAPAVPEQSSIEQQIPVPNSAATTATQTPANVATPPAPAVPSAESMTPPVAEKTKSEPPTAPPVPTPPTVEVEEYQWDSDIVKPENNAASAAASSVNFETLGSALNLEAKSQDDFVAKVNERLSKVKNEVLDGVPESLKQALEIAKKGGDWLAYTNATSVDFSKIPSETLFEKEFERINLSRFRNPDGSIDYEKYDQEYEATPLSMRLMRGEQIKSDLIQRQEQQKVAILAQTTKQQEQFSQGIADAARDLSNILPKEKFGITIEPRHTSYFYEGIANGSLIKKHLGDIDLSSLSRADGRLLTRTIVLAELGEKIGEYRFKQGETAGKKKVWLETQNVQTQGPSYTPRPEEPQVAQRTSVDMTRAHLSKMKPPNSL